MIAPGTVSKRQPQAKIITTTTVVNVFDEPKENGNHESHDHASKGKAPQPPKTPEVQYKGEFRAPDRNAEAAQYNHRERQKVSRRVETSERRERKSEHASTPTPTLTPTPEIASMELQGGAKEFSYFNFGNTAVGAQENIPPQEPPIDYEETLSTKKAAEAQKAAEEKQRSIGLRKHPNRQTVTKKTRSYVIDGVQMTSTTVHVLGVREDKALR